MSPYKKSRRINKRKNSRTSRKLKLKTMKKRGGMIRRTRVLPKPPPVKHKSKVKIKPSSSISSYPSKSRSQGFEVKKENIKSN